MQNRNTKRNNKLQTRRNNRNYRGGVTLKALSAAAFAGMFIFGASANGAVEASERIDNNLVEANVNNVVFENLTGQNYGGALFNNKDNGNVNINSDFHNNYVSSENNSVYGGAIYNGLYETFNRNTDTSPEVTEIPFSAIGNINGNFTNNYAHGRTADGGAICNAGKINNISGYFENNNVTGGDVRGGAIYNAAYSVVTRTSNTLQQSSDAMLAQSAGNARMTIQHPIEAQPGAGTVDQELSVVGNCINKIEGTFIGNYASGENAYGGAIFNTSISNNEIVNIKRSNNVQALDAQVTSGLGSTAAVNGIDTIEGNFTGNYAEGENAYGGAIYNGSNTSIISQAHGGSTESVLPLSRVMNVQHNMGAQTGARTLEQDLTVAGTYINKIDGTFTGNYASGENAYGGAIFNGIAVATTNNNQGVLDLNRGFVIYHNPTSSNVSINEINGTFTGNYASGENAYGGAIYNAGGPAAAQQNQAVLPLLKSSLSSGMVVQPNITEMNPANNMLGQSSLTANTNASIGEITGVFKNNSVQGNKSAMGGAIYNTGLIGSAIVKEMDIASPVNPDLAQAQQVDQPILTIGDTNYDNAAHNRSLSGSSSSSSLKINRAGDTATDLAIGETHREQIKSQPSTSQLILDGGIKASFYNNFAKSTDGFALGGAIYNTGSISKIQGDFVGNRAEGKAAVGGAIYNDAALNLYSNNSISISNEGVPQKNLALLLDGYPVSDDSTSMETSSSESGLTKNVSAVSSKNNEKLTSNYKINQAADDKPGLSIEEKTFDKDAINVVNSSFYNNYAKSTDGEAKGGAIYTTSDMNFVAKDGYTAVFKGNYTESAGKRDDNAIYVGCKVNNQENILNDDTNIAQEINRFDNDSPLNSSANLLLTNNSNNNSGLSEGLKKVENLSTGIPINTQQTVPTLTFKMENGGKFVMLDNIDGDTIKIGIVGEGSSDESNIKDVDIATELDKNTESLVSDSENISNTGKSRMIVQENIPASNSPEENLADKTDLKTFETYYNVNIEGDNIDNTTFYMLNDIRNASVKLSNTTINTINNQVHVYDFGRLVVGADTKMAADVDLYNSSMDRFTAKGYTRTVLSGGNLAADETLNMTESNLRDTDAPVSQSLNLSNASAGYKLNRAEDDANSPLVHEVQEENHNGSLIVSDMNILSDAKTDRTEIYFAQPGLKDNVKNEVSTVYTPIYKYDVRYESRDDAGYFLFTRGGGKASDAFNPAVLTAPVSSVAATQATINEAFKYVFEHADAFTQFPAMERTAKIEANRYTLSTEYNENLDLHDHGSLCVDHNNKAAWVKPYSTFENMNLKNGPKVDAITYGTMIGYDGDFKESGKGWHRIGTSYIGYNGSQLSYAGNDTTMNGGLLGLTETFYKGNFWTAITASAGASVGETTTMYGKEDYTSLLAGVGSKTGYNFEFKEGKFIVQPIMFMSYTFVNTFDYTNAAGVKINTKPAHSIQLNPSVRLIGNLKNGWQPYASVGMVWNVMNKSDVSANGVKLPEMSMKPYVEYGVGVQRNWADKFTAFGQAMIRNGGRNGVALSAGFRWALGHDGDDKKNVNAGASDKVVIKQMNGAASAAGEKTVLKQLKRPTTISLSSVKH